MITVAYGTTGELIKLAPVLVELKRRGDPVITLCTGQQAAQIPALLEDLDLPQPDIWLASGNRGRDLERPSDLPQWLARVVYNMAVSRRSLMASARSSSTQPVMIIHGDTLTAVLGTLMARSMRIPVAHIEAGMRSGNWRNPFPEELDRRTISRLAAIHFAPGPHAVANLRAERAPGAIVETYTNTVVDALDLGNADFAVSEAPDEPFGLVSLRQFWSPRSRDALRSILELLNDASERWPMLFIDHPVTAAAIEANGFGRLFGERFVRIPRQRYFHFVALLRRSAFVVTDSGGTQQECAWLGQPCLVHRAVTEHPDGLDGPVVLSRMDPELVRRFLADPTRLRAEPIRPARRPTDVIVDCLALGGYIEPGSVNDASASPR